jgi:hypothetical protein
MNRILYPVCALFAWTVVLTSVRHLPVMRKQPARLATWSVTDREARAGFEPSPAQAFMSSTAVAGGGSARRPARDDTAAV